jgi:hypothetical protein
MYDYPVEKKKKIVDTFQALLKEEETIGKQTTIAGWKQRNALVAHVYSNYNEHEKLCQKKKEWEDLGFQHRVLMGLAKLLKKHIDLYGYFPNYSDMLDDFDELVETSIKMEKFEIATILKKWRDRFPEPQ